MAIETVDSLGELTSPASTDEIGIWDVSAGQYLKITRANLIGATLTGGGTVATGGYTLTVPATGTAGLLAVAQTWTARQTFSGGVNASGGVRTTQVTIDDDAIVDLVATYGAPVEGVFLYQVGNAQGYSGIVSIRAASTPYCQLLVQYGATTSVGTTELTAGTSDGTDGNVNIAATSDGKLIVKNRTGASRRFTFLVIG